MVVRSDDNSIGLTIGRVTYMCEKIDDCPIGRPSGRVTICLKFINGGDKVASRSNGSPIGLPLDPGVK
ncbi:hypothetical protein Hanom_Chr06g00537661 [Helianthus anomalus]